MKQVTSRRRALRLVAVALFGALATCNVVGAAHASLSYRSAAASPSATRTAGITQTRQGPFATGIFRATGVWQGPIGGRWLVIYAGGIPARSAPGLPVQVAAAGLRIYTEPMQAGGADDRLTYLGTVIHRDGKVLTLRSQSNAYLRLVDDVGTAVTFDTRFGGFVADATGSTGALFECPAYDYDQRAPTPLLHAMQRWSKRHGFSVLSAQMSAALPLPTFTTNRVCVTPRQRLQHKPLKVPSAATEVRSVLARIRYPGSDGEQPSPGRPYFLAAKVKGVWMVAMADGDDAAWTLSCTVRQSSGICA